MNRTHRGNPDRGVSTVADVSLAIVLIVAAAGVLVTFADGSEQRHEPLEADHTAQTVAASTLNTTYNVSAAVDALDEEYDYDSPYEDDQLERVTHGPVAAQIADVAVANVEFSGERLSKEAVDYERVLDERLQTRLADVQFNTQVSAHWTPFGGADVRGTTTIGQTPPSDADVSTTTFSVSSGMPDAREEAIDAVETDSDYHAVARAVADAVVAGYVPELESQRALESSGLDYLLTTYRYNRMATLLAGDTDEFERNDWLVPTEADSAAANAYLSDHLAAELEHQLEALDGDVYDSATEAAQHVSTDEVTIIVRTWTDD